MASEYKHEGAWSRLSLYLWAAWAALLALGFMLLEYYGLRRRGDEFPPLTYVIRRYIPAWAFFAVLGAGAGWLVWHFLATYL